MKKTRKAAAVLTAVAMAAVSAAPVMADEIKDLYDYELQSREIETWNILQSQLMSDTNVLTNLYDGLVEADEYGIQEKYAKKNISFLYMTVVEKI